MSQQRMRASRNQLVPDRTVCRRHCCNRELNLMAKSEASTFTPDQVARHIHRKHPRCPQVLAQVFVEAISTRTWDPPVSLGRAFGIVSTNTLRHEHTDYERLMRDHHLRRDEARLVVGEEIKAALASWRKVGGKVD